MATSEWETLKVETVDHITIIAFNRPEKRNAMSPRLHEEMNELLGYLAYDPNTRVLILTGTGDSFCAGQDLKEFFLELEKDRVRRDRIHRLAVEWRARLLRFFPKPTIAAVNGYCFGGAFTIVEACDLAIAADEATFGLSEINFRLFPGGSVTKSIVELLPRRHALYYALTGEPFDGKRAAEIGLVNFSVPRAELMERTMQLARQLVEKDPVALRAVKEAYHHSIGMSWDAAIDYAFAKEAQTTLAQEDSSWLREAIPDFLRGRYRPGLETHRPEQKGPTGR